MNHFMLGHLMEWHYAYLAGIRQQPGGVGWKKVLIAPTPEKRGTEATMDERRIEELSHKRHETGLSDEEADELGRLFAEQEGKPYSNAKLSKLPPGERGGDVLVPDAMPEGFRTAEEVDALATEAEKVEEASEVQAVEAEEE